MFKRIFFALILSVCLFGCPEVGILSDGLVLVDDVEQLEVAEMSTDTMVMHNDADSSVLTVGDIIIGADNGGYLRRVTALSNSKSNNDIFLMTEPASLTDVVEQGTLLQTVQFTQEDYTKSGLKVDKAQIVDLSGMDIYRDYGIAISIDNGTLDCTPNIGMLAVFDDFKLSTFDLNISGDIALDLDFNIAVDENYVLSFETDIIEPLVYPFVTSIGPIPVYGSAKLSFPIGINGSFDGDTSVAFGFDIYNDFSIATSYTDGVWTTDKDLNNWVATGHPPVWIIEVGFDAQVYIKVVAEVKLYESAELGLFLKPYVNADISVIPPPSNVTLLGGLDAGGWYGLSIFDMDILGDSFYWNGPSTELFSWTQ